MDRIFKIISCPTANANSKSVHKFSYKCLNVIFSGLQCFYCTLWERRNQCVAYIRLGGFGGILCVYACMCVSVWWGDYKGKIRLRLILLQTTVSTQTFFANMLWQHKVVMRNVMCSVDDIYVLFSATHPFKTKYIFPSHICSPVDFWGQWPATGTKLLQGS